VNSFGANRKDLALHPTVKPVALVADAIKDVTKRGEVVLDVFVAPAQRFWPPNALAASRA